MNPALSEITHCYRSLRSVHRLPGGRVARLFAQGGGRMNFHRISA